MQTICVPLTQLLLQRGPQAPPHPPAQHPGTRSFLVLRVQSVEPEIALCCRHVHRTNTIRPEPSASVKKDLNCGLLTEGLLTPLLPPHPPLCPSWEGGEEGAQNCCFLSKPVFEKESLPCFFSFSKSKRYAKFVIRYK